MKKVIVAGHICIDITPMFDCGEVRDIADILQPGKLIQMKNVDVHTGGAVANTGLAMKILGADVSLMGKLGDDEFGNMIRNILDDYHASENMIIASGESTSYSVVLAIPGIDRIFLHNPGANDSFSADDVSDEDLDGVSLFHFGYPSLMKNMYVNDGAELTKLFKKIKDKGVTTSLDMAAVDPNTPAGRADWDTILKSVLPYVDFFVPSVEELCFMLDRERLSEWQLRDNHGDITSCLRPEEDIKPLADKCLEYGAKVVLIKSGAPGIYYATADTDSLKMIEEDLGIDASQWANRIGFERSYKPRKVVSGTGAGDTSIAAFLCSVLQGESIDECLRMAVATGTSCVEAIDALSGLSSLEELKQRIKTGWDKIGD